MRQGEEAARISLANHDQLTGLFNLTGILDYIQNSGKYEVSPGSAIIYLNVMNFKTFNSRYGFAGGNEYLKGIADEIQNIFCDEAAARTGGDQFIIVSAIKSEEEIIAKIETLREHVRQYQKELPMRIKAGIYFANGLETDKVILIDRAKAACDDIIKVYDKDNNIYDDDLNKRNELRQYVIDNFESAFKNRYFKVYYQKEVRAITQKVCGYEALSRWMDPVHGIISPAMFVEVLENARLIHKLDIYIIDQVCKDLSEVIAYGQAVEPVSVNLSRLDFELCDIRAEVDKCREKYNIPVQLLNIEITESAISSGEEVLIEQVRKFRESGYEVWMDDFGAGYSSFNNLKKYDFDTLKIDMDFLKEFETNKKAKVIIANIVNMAKELGIHTLAEGVETIVQYEFLSRIGCEKMQGYLFSKPKPLEEFDKDLELGFGMCEEFSLKDYYDSIGEINFLGAVPLRPRSFQVINNIPIAIVEAEGRNVRFLYMNTAYIEFLNSVGISMTYGLEAGNMDMEMPEIRGFFDFAAKAESSEDKRGEQDFIINSNLVNAKIRFLSRHGDRACYALVSRNATVSGSEADTADDIGVAMVQVFNQYFRVDLFDDRGGVQNIFLNGKQVAVADLEKDAVKAVKRYAELYLPEDERQRFIEYYDISTVHERLKGTNNKYLVEYFHSAIEDDHGRMQMYMIMPFYYNNRWRYISCCRYADEISDDYPGGR